MQSVPHFLTQYGVMAGYGPDGNNDILLFRTDFTLPDLQRHQRDYRSIHTAALRVTCTEVLQAAVGTVRNITATWVSMTVRGIVRVPVVIGGVLYPYPDWCVQGDIQTLRGDETAEVPVCEGDSMVMYVRTSRRSGRPTIGLLARDGKKRGAGEPWRVKAPVPMPIAHRVSDATRVPGKPTDPAVTMALKSPEFLYYAADRDIAGMFRWLLKRSLTQRRLAQLTGQSQSDISQILRGRDVLYYSLLVRIADGLGVPRGLMGLAYTTGLGLLADQEDAAP